MSIMDIKMYLLKERRIEEKNERKHFMASFPEQINMNFVPCKHKAQEIIYLDLFLKGTKTSFCE